VVVVRQAGATFSGRCELLQLGLEHVQAQTVAFALIQRLDLLKQFDRNVICPTWREINVKMLRSVAQ